MLISVSRLSIGAQRARRPPRAPARRARRSCRRASCAAAPRARSCWRPCPAMRQHLHRGQPGVGARARARRRGPGPATAPPSRLASRLAGQRLAQQRHGARRRRAWPAPRRRPAAACGSGALSFSRAITGRITRRILLFISPSRSAAGRRASPARRSADRSAACVLASTDVDAAVAGRPSGGRRTAPPARGSAVASPRSPRATMVFSTASTSAEPRPAQRGSASGACGPGRRGRRQRCSQPAMHEDERPMDRRDGAQTAHGASLLRLMGCVAVDVDGHWAT